MCQNVFGYKYICIASVVYQLSALELNRLGSLGSFSAQRIPTPLYILLPWRRCPYLDWRKPIFRHCSGGHM